MWDKPSVKITEYGTAAERKQKYHYIHQFEGSCFEYRARGSKTVEFRHYKTVVASVRPVTYEEAVGQCLPLHWDDGSDVEYQFVHIDAHDSNQTRSILHRVAHRFSLPFSFYGASVLMHATPTFLDSRSLDGSALLPPRHYVKYHGNNKTGWGGYRNLPDAKVRVSVGDIDDYVPLPKKKVVPIQEWVSGEKVDGVWVGGGWQDTDKTRIQRVMDDEYYTSTAMRAFLARRKGLYTHCTLHLPDERVMRGEYNISDRTFRPERSRKDTPPSCTFYPTDGSFQQRAEAKGTHVVCARSYYADKQIDAFVRKAKRALPTMTDPHRSIMAIALELHNKPTYFTLDKIKYVTKGYLEDGSILLTGTRESSVSVSCSVAACVAQEMYEMLCDPDTINASRGVAARAAFPGDVFNMVDAIAWGHCRDMTGAELLAYMLGQFDEYTMNTVFLRGLNQIDRAAISMPVIEGT